MKRILIGLIVVAVVAAGGWFGFNLYAQHRATAEVEAAFEQIRKQGGKASHGKIAFDLPTRTLTIEDIAVTPGKAPQAQIRIASIKGTGVRQIDETRFSADGIDITGLEVALDQIGAAKLKVAYKIPQLVMRDYAGPVHADQRAGGRLAGRHVPLRARPICERRRRRRSRPRPCTISIRRMPRAAGSGEVTYSGLAIQNLKHGKIDAMKVGPRRDLGQRAAARQGGQADAAKCRTSSSTISTSTAISPRSIRRRPATTAIIGSTGRSRQAPMRSNRHRGCECRSTGSPWKTSPIQPSKFRLAEIFAALPRDQSAPPTPAQAREMMEKLAGAL